MSRGRGLRAWGWSVLLLIKHIIVWFLPDPLPSPRHRLVDKLTTVCRHLHNPGMSHTHTHSRRAQTHMHTQCQWQTHIQSNAHIQAHTKKNPAHKFACKHRVCWSVWLTWYLLHHSQQQLSSLRTGIGFTKCSRRLQLWGGFLHSSTQAHGWLH